MSSKNIPRLFINKELKAKNKNITYKEVLKSIKKRDKSDKNRKISPLKKTKDMYLINSSSESIITCFMKIKKITLLSLLFIFLSCNDNQLKIIDKKGEKILEASNWIPLFKKNSLDGWHYFQDD